MKRVVNQNFLTMNNLSKLLKHPNQDYLQTEQKILQVTEPFTNLFNLLNTCAQHKSRFFFSTKMVSKVKKWVTC